MAASVIKSQALGKKYIISHEQRGPYTAFRDVVSNKTKELLKGKNGVPAKEEFWALKDISFEINQGESIGIIGKNGAGKSTLLKILSRITEPTRGRVEINGRVASLLEVGTGFHPELTGRENIFLNGAILGMKRTEVKRKFNEIVEFSGIERFLDTPVKRYSSGMYLRLAFAVAAHLEPEILLIDEVLAVGDAEFQRKCLGKMEEVSRGEGRTILFVSHNLEAVSKFCNRGILLEQGEIRASGDIKSVIDVYTRQFLQPCQRKDWEKSNMPGDDQVRLSSVWLHDTRFEPRSEFRVTERIGVSIEYEVLQDNVVFTHGLNVYNANGINIFNSHDVNSGLGKTQRKKGRYRATVWMPENIFPEELFTVGIALFSPQPFYIHAHKNEVLSFKTTGALNGVTARGDYMGTDFGGIIRPLLQWEASQI